MKKVLGHLLFIVMVAAAAVYSSSILNGNRAFLKDNQAYQNAYQHLQEITKDYHPSDSEGIIAVREYLESQLQAMGASYQVLEDGYKVADWIELMVDEYEAGSQDRKSRDDAQAESYGFSTFRDYITDVARSMYGGPDGEIVMNNILVKVDGTGNQGVMFAAHYDTSYESYGAGDDGVAVAGMLEAVRTSLKENCANDLYFLFTDGEEKTLWGSHAFVQEHPDMKDRIKAIFNLEGRGSKGTPILFEASENNYGLIKEVNKALRYSTGYSFVSDIYQYMPNCSDLNEFMDAGYAGANFAFSGIEENNHNPSDSLENLSKKAVYDMVMLQQELVKYFSSSELSKLTSDTDAVFLPLVKGHLLVIPGSIMQALAYITIIALLAVVLLLLYKKEIKIKRLALCILSLLVFLILIFGVNLITGLPASFIYSKLLDRTWGDNPDYAGLVNAGRLHYVFFWQQLIITLGLAYIFKRFTERKRHAGKELLVICLLAEAAAILVMTFTLSGISYLIAVPALFTAAVQLILRFCDEKRRKLIRRTAAFLSPAITIIILLPFAEAIYRGLRITYIFFVTPVISVLIAVPLLSSLLWLEEDKEKEKVTSKLHNIL